MSVDVAGAINVVSTLVIIGILLVGIFRALEMRRAFVKGAYRSRATWSTLLMLVIIPSMAENFVNVPNFGLLSLLGFLPFIALVLVIFAYADRSVLVAIETDFFHRDTLGWLRARWPIAIFLISTMAVEVVGGLVLTPAAQNSFLGDVLNGLFFVSLAPILGYATAALIVGARRSADRTLRRSILLFGLALSTLVISIVVSAPFASGTLPYVIVNQGTGIVGIYLIYRSMMSLSPLGRVEKQFSVTSKPGEGGVIPPVQP
jgi:hypothetical protein